MKKHPPQLDNPPTRILLDVTNYAANVFAGMSDEPVGKPESKKAIGIVNIYGISKPAGWAFRVSAYPNGTKLPKAFLRTDTLIPIAEMSIHQSQMAAVLTVLNDADAAHAVYDTDTDGTIYADVQGEFKKSAKPALKPRVNESTLPISDS